MDNKGFLGVVRSGLGVLADFQLRRPFLLACLLLVFSLVTFYGSFFISLQSDLSELDPQDIPVTQLRNRISSSFNEFESVVILVELDDSQDRELFDIRDPVVLRFVSSLHDRLERDSLISSVQSAKLFFPGGIPDTLGESTRVLNAIPDASRVFSPGFDWTIVFVEADVGGDSSKIAELNRRVDEILSSTTIPGGLMITTTGDAPLNATIFRLLISDAFFTLLFSTIVIYLLVVLIQRSFRRALVITTPLLLGILWTVGTMGLLGIPITVATAAMGAVLLGLGVEYSIFLYSRYREEHVRLPRDVAIREAVVEVGSTLVSSGTTTLLGFLALGLSVFPVLSDLGKTLGIGIFFMLAATIVASPLIMQLGGESGVRKSSLQKSASRVDLVYRGFGRFVSRRPVFVLVISLFATGLMFYASGFISNQDVNFETILPSDLDEMIAYSMITDAFGEGSEILLYVSVEPQQFGSDEVVDIRDPRVLEYLRLLQEQVVRTDFVVGTSSIADFVVDSDGRVPHSLPVIRELLDNPFARADISRSNDATLIRVSLVEDASDDPERVISSIRQIVDSTPSVPGVVTRLSGGLVVESELEALNQPDSARTSLIAFGAIIVFLFLLSRSVKATLLPLVTVVLAVIWTLGLTGLFQIPFNNISSSVITMTIGIGIDFGLQVMNRYGQERKSKAKRLAMEDTVVAIMTPMVITVVAAVIGFRAMGLGQLTLLGDLGVLMSFGIIASMVVSLTAVASLILLTDRDKVSVSSTKIVKKNQKGVLS